MNTAQNPIRFDGVHCSLVLERPADSVVLLRISGTDTGELADAPMQVLNGWLTSSARVKFFIDARPCAALP
jgi:hypothetical protein